MQRMIRLVRLAGMVLLAMTLGAGAAGADEYYFAMIFGSQSKPKLLRYTHTWATIVRAVGEGPDLNAYQPRAEHDQLAAPDARREGPAAEARAGSQPRPLPDAPGRDGQRRVDHDVGPVRGPPRGLAEVAADPPDPRERAGRVPGDQHGRGTS